MAADDEPAAVLSRMADEGRILDCLPVLVAWVDADERYRFANSSYEAWFGQPRDDIAGRRLRDVLGEAAYDTVRPFVQRALAGERVTFEQAIPYPSGPRDVQVTYSPLRCPDGRPDGFVAIVTDVSDRHSAESALRASEQRLREVIRVQRLISTELDLQKIVQAVTDAATSVSGAEFGAFFYNVVGSPGTELEFAL